jgi:hypothetical protein
MQVFEIFSGSLVSGVVQADPVEIEARRQLHTLPYNLFIVVEDAWWQHRTTKVVGKKVPGKKHLLLGVQ